jgi:hypothetical protein
MFARLPVDRYLEVNTVGVEPHGLKLVAPPHAS